MNLLLYPDRLLRVRSSFVESVTPAVRTYLDEMMDRMDEWGGVGLAAPQCGLLMRMFVTHLPGQGRMAFINPRIEDLQEGIETMTEGCLSLPGAVVEVSRPSAVRVQALDYQGKPVEIYCRGLSSACVQHEADHLDGILILDKAESTERRVALQNIWDAEHPRH
jgi:peptide deformylase